jgi:hypothetical protein
VRRAAPAAACLCLLGLLCLALLPLALAGCGESGAAGASGSAGASGNGSPAAGGSPAAVGAAGSTPAQRRLTLERADLAIVARGLAGAEPPIEREIVAARSAWPGIVEGLPQVVAPASRALMFVGMRRSEELSTPGFISYAGQLTGSSAAIAGLLLSYEQLAQRGWTMTLAAAAHLDGSSALPASALEFLRTNAALYIGCIYDAHYNLSVIGERMRSAYAKLGGPAGFGGTGGALPASLMAGVIAFYSPPSARLAPKPPSTAAGG